MDLEDLAQIILEEYPEVDDAVYRVISVIADDIERMNVGKLPVGLSGTRYDSYILGAKDEHNYIVEYFRGLLDT